MRVTKHNTHINRSPNPDGTRNVSFYLGGEKGWMPAGVLMPEVTNHVREQPKSLAYKLTAAKVAARRAQ